MLVEYDTCGRMKYNPELHGRNKIPWTVEEIEYLIEWYGIIGAEEMSLALERTEGVINYKISELRKRGLMEKPKRKINIRRLLRVKDEETIWI